MTEPFLRNHWYAAIWASEVGDEIVGRRLLDEPVALFRDADVGLLVASRVLHTNHDPA